MKNICVDIIAEQIKPRRSSREEIFEESQCFDCITQISVRGAIEESEKSVLEGLCSIADLGITDELLARTRLSIDLGVISQGAISQKQNEKYDFEIRHIKGVLELVESQLKSRLNYYEDCIEQFSDCMNNLQEAFGCHKQMKIYCVRNIENRKQKLEGIEEGEEIQGAPLAERKEMVQQLTNEIQLYDSNLIKATINEKYTEVMHYKYKDLAGEYTRSKYYCSILLNKISDRITSSSSLIEDLYKLKVESENKKIIA